jgi:hypothetical protein
LPLLIGVLCFALAIAPLGRRRAGAVA